MSAASGVALARAIGNLGAPTQVPRAYACGPDALIRSIRSELKPGMLVVAERPGSDIGKGEPFDLIILSNGIEQGGLQDVRDRLSRAVSRLGADGRLVLYFATLATPLAPTEAQAPFGPHDALLFPESVAAGDIGPDAAGMSRLSPASWRLLFASLGLEVVAEGGQGELRLPAAVLEGHQSRLAPLDAHELATGRLLMILKRRETRA